MSHDIEDTLNPYRVRGVWLGAGWAAQWLVVAGRVDGEFADEFVGGGVDDADVQVVDEHEDRGPGVVAADGCRRCGRRAGLWAGPGR